MEESYVFYQATQSLCDVCLKKIDAKIIIQEGKVFILKTCPDCGTKKHILEHDADYHLKKILYDKPKTAHRSETKVQNGCPFDCGLCEQHEQHTCIGLIEITDACDMGCSICYAKSSSTGKELSLEKIEEMVDFYIESEGGRAEILQLSGGEPTQHSQIIDILKLCKSKNLGYIMLNTNGSRLANDEDFVSGLSDLAGGFEVYLQFDGLSDEVYSLLRGKENMLNTKLRAIENLNKYDIPTTLVCTVHDGINEKELVKLIEFGLKTPCVRGVNFQPLARFGRSEAAETESLSVSGVINLIESTSAGLLKANDFIPLPCNVERVAVTYLYKHKGGFIPITRNKNIEKYVPHINNTFLFTIDDMLADGEAPKFGFCRCLDFLNDFKSVVPRNFMLLSRKERVKYLNENTFRISISSFVDRFNFDLKSVQKECVHVITEDKKRIPFSTYNIFRRK